MSLKSQLEADIKTALLAKDTLRVDTLKGVKTAVQYEEVAKGLRETGLSDDAVEAVIAREIKKRDEAATMYEKGGNPTAAKKELDEKEILKTYLPEPVSEQDLKSEIDALVAKLDEKSPSAMGGIIGAVKAKYGAAADGALVARLTREALQ